LLSDGLAGVFDKVWWDPAGKTYSMSLSQGDNRQVPVPHWAVIVPLEVGLASQAHAATTLATLQAEYLNEWGLKHTVGDDERVWTIPTALLSKAAYRYGRPELGFEMLHHLTDTLDHGSIGMFHELIPQGLGFLVLWSAAAFVRGVVEDLMGVEVQADLHKLTVTPQLPEGWDYAEMENLTFGNHVVSLRLLRTGVVVTHISGPVALTVDYRLQDGTGSTRLVEPGDVEALLGP
jgi:glycogen debranching enzyme